MFNELTKMEQYDVEGGLVDNKISKIIKLPGLPILIEIIKGQDKYKILPIGPIHIM